MKIYEIEAIYPHWDDDEDNERIFIDKDAAIKQANKDYEYGKEFGGTYVIDELTYPEMTEDNYQNAIIGKLHPIHRQRILTLDGNVFVPEQNY